MTKTAVVSRDHRDAEMNLVQMYVDGLHIGYIKLERGHANDILQILEQAGKFVVIRTT